MYGIKSTVSKCASHLASGNIRRWWTSVNQSQQDAVNLYQNLRALLTHFTHSTKSIGILKWGLWYTWDKQCSHSQLRLNRNGHFFGCLYPVITHYPILGYFSQPQDPGRWNQIIASLKGVFPLQLFADLHQAFANRYLRQVYSDEVLICEIHYVACKTADVLLDENLSTPLADTVYDSFKEDQHSNIITVLT